MKNYEQHQEGGDFSGINEEAKVYYEYRQRDITKKKMQRRYVITTVLLVYSTAVFLLLNVWSGLDTTSFKNLSFSRSQIKDIEEKINLLQKSDLQLNTSLLMINDILTTSPTSSSVALLDKRIDEIKEKQQNIEQTILLDADKAITARLIREKQDSLNSQMTELKSAYGKLDDKFNTIIYTIIFGPIMLTVLGFAINHIYKKIFQKEKGE